MESNNGGCLKWLLIALIIVIILCNPLSFLFGSAVAVGFLGAIPKKVLIGIIIVIILFKLLRK